MNPTILGSKGPGFLNQVPTLALIRVQALGAALGFGVGIGFTGVVYGLGRQTPFSAVIMFNTVVQLTFTSTARMTRTTLPDP